MEIVKEIEVDARLTWIGTNHIAYDYSTPSLAVDNHMICTILDSNNPIFLDPTEKFSPYKEFANRLQGKQALIENGDDFILKTVPILEANKSKEEKKYQLKISNDDLEGNAELHYTGESRKQVLSYLNTLQNNKKEDFLKFFLEEGNNSIMTQNIESSNLNNREEDILIDYDVLFKGKVSSFGDKTYIDLNLANNISEYPLEDRKSDFVFSHKKILKSETEIDITGYTVLEMPKSLSFEDEDVILEVGIEQVENDIVFSQKIKILNEVIHANKLEEWNQKIKQINNFYNQQIVLQKI